MTNMVHLIPTQTDATAKQIAKLYVKEVVRLHGLLESIVSNRDIKFTSQFWKELSRLLGQRLLMSSYVFILSPTNGRLFGMSHPNYVTSDAYVG